MTTAPQLAVRPAAPLWAPALAAAGGVILAGITLLVGGYLGLGLLAGPLNWLDLLVGFVWSPAHGQFGAAAMVYGSVVVSALALAVAVPLGFGAAIALHEHVPARVARPLRSCIELLAVVPSIVYGLLGIALIRPLIAELAGVPGGDSLLAAALVLAVMVLPTIVAVGVDALAAVPASTREAARALGLTSCEVVRSAVLPLARAGMWAGVALGLARALGETIAVYLVIGRADGQLPTSPLAVLSSLAAPGQTITTKLGGPEPSLAFDGSHRAALSLLGVLLVVVVGLATYWGARGRRRHSGVLVWLTRLDRRHSSPRWRRQRDQAIRWGRMIAVTVPCALLAAMLVVLVGSGTKGLDPRFWLTPASGASTDGVRDQVLGTLLLILATAAVSLPAGLGLGLLISEYAGPRMAAALRTCAYMVSGLPTIVLGLAGLAVFTTALGWGKSWLAGVLVLVPVVIPVVALAAATRAGSLPLETREAARALGLTRTQLVRSVVIPYARPAAITGLMLGCARAAGETAPLLFTATVFSGAATWPSGIVNAPIQTLPTHIFTLAQDAADQAAVQAAWASALVLVIVAGTLMAAAAWLRRGAEVRT